MLRANFRFPNVLRVKDMSMIEEFKKFIQRGNVVDMAVGIVIGAAFSKIVSAMVEGILTPPIGWILSGVDFSQFGLTLKHGTAESPGEVKLYIGRLIQATIDFVIVAFCLFLVIKGMNKLRRTKDEAPKEPAEDVKLLTEIRDLLKSKT